MKGLDSVVHSPVSPVDQLCVTSAFQLLNQELEKLSRSRYGR